MSKVKIGERVERRELQAACKYQNFPRDLNIHDPKNQYRWEGEGEGWVIWTGRALFTVGFLTGIYCLVFLGMLL